MNLVSMFIAVAIVAQSGDVSQVDQPYDVTICLRVSDSPMLTDYFVASVRRQVSDQLTNYFQGFARISVAPNDHWLVEKFSHAGVERPQWNAETWKAGELSDKTFLFYLDCPGNSYEISWRELDRDAQQAGPIHTRATPDRRWVAKAVCLAVKETFGLTAAVSPKHVDSLASVRFRGREWKSQIADMIGATSVLKPFWVIRRRNGELMRYPIRDTLLVVNQKDTKTARVVSNLSNPWKRTAVVAGFEAVRVVTTSGYLRLRIVDAVTGEPATNCKVFVNDKGFDQYRDADNLGIPSRDGYVVTRNKLQNLAYVKVSQGSASIVQMPIPITSSICEQTIKIAVDPEAKDKFDFDRRLRFLVHDLQTIKTAQDEASKNFNKLNDAKRYEDALKLLGGTLAMVQPLLGDAKTDVELLQKESDILAMADSGFLKSVREQVVRIGGQRDALNRTREAIKEAIETREAGKRAKVLFEMGQQAEAKGDIDEAIARYELSLDEHDLPGLREKLNRVKQLWDVGDSAAWAEAHKTIYEKWPNVEITGLEAMLPDVQKALTTLKANGDYLRAYKLLDANGTHLADLNTIVGQLARRVGEEDQKEKEKFAALTEKLANFQEQVGNFITRTLKNPQANEPPLAPLAEPAPKKVDPPNQKKPAGRSILDVDEKEEPLER